MLEVLKESERAVQSLGWLESRHSFNMGGMDADDFNGFRSLSEINDDILAPGAGFPMHKRHDMEIVCFVIEGEMSHEDSYGHRTALGAGNVFRMSAGTGINHREANLSATDPLHMVQIWMRPDRIDLKPGYEQMRLCKEEIQGRLRLTVSGDREEGTLFIHQDAHIYEASLQPGEKVRHTLGANRHVWVQMVSGSALVNGVALERGDGASISEESEAEIECVTPCWLLLFSLD